DSPEDGARPCPALETHHVAVFPALGIVELLGKVDRLVPCLGILDPFLLENVLPIEGRHDVPVVGKAVHWPALRRNPIKVPHPFGHVLLVIVPPGLVPAKVVVDRNHPVDGVDSWESSPVDIAHVEVRRVRRHAGRERLEVVVVRLAREYDLDVGKHLVEERLHRALGIAPPFALLEKQYDFPADVRKDLPRIVSGRDCANCRSSARFQECAAAKQVSVIVSYPGPDKCSGLMVMVVHIILPAVSAEGNWRLRSWNLSSGKSDGAELNSDV